MKNHQIHNTADIEERILELKNKQVRLAAELDHQLKHLRENARPMMVNTFFHSSRQPGWLDRIAENETVKKIVTRFADNISVKAIDKIDELLFHRRNRS